MPQTPHGYSPTHDPVFLGVAGFLAGTGTVLAWITEPGSGIMLPFLLVAVIVLIWTLYLRARGSGGPPAP